MVENGSQEEVAQVGMAFGEGGVRCWVLPREGAERKQKLAV